MAGLTENKTKPSSWGLAKLGNRLSRAGWGTVVTQDMWCAVGFTVNKTKPSSWGLADLGNRLSRAGHPEGVRL